MTTDGRPTGCGVKGKSDGGEGGVVELRFVEVDYLGIEKGTGEIVGID